VENEYGSFGCDKNYTSFIRDQIRYHLGEELVLFTNDGAGDRNMQCGSVPGVFPTLDFGPGMRNFSFSKASLAVMKSNFNTPSLRIMYVFFS
jgi:hypothetical protein